MTPDEVARFSESVAGTVVRWWGRAADAPTADLAALWTAGAGQGWFELGSFDQGPGGALAAALAAVRELGRVACPLPVMDGFAAARLLRREDKLAHQLAAGELRVLIASPSSRRNENRPGAGPAYLDAAPAATHVLVLPPPGDPARLCPVTDRREQPGLAVPSWHTVELGPAEAELDLAPGQADEAVTLLRLGLAARVLAAAERSHEMALEHAKTRRQFGRVIGSFGAVQQRTATSQIDVSAARSLIAQARDAYGRGRGDWALQAEIAVEFIAAAARRVQLAAQHTLAAMGYFEEHDAPWLFRRVHADVARLATLPALRGEVADVLAETGVSLPAFDFGPAGEAFRQEVRAFLAGHARAAEPAHPPARAGGSPGEDRAAFDPDVLVPAMAERGWFGLGWPAAVGGRDASLAEQVALHEEVTYSRAPVATQLNSVTLLGNSILRHGTDEQKATFLPLIRAGQLRFCLGYSEPEAGSDLASLRTRADRCGDGWVINGQKLWTTRAHVASHVWLATRTDQEAVPKHAGITVFLVPMDTPGITVQQHRGLSGEVSCTVFYDDVRVPDAARVGAVNGGWKVITDALAGERVVMGGIGAGLLRQLDDLLAVVCTDPDTWVGPRGSARRARLGELAVTLQASRALTAAAIGATAAGGGARLEAPMAGVLGGELAEAFGEAMLDILGPQAALSADHPGVPGGGAFEYGLRLSIMYVVGGGTNDIQRGLIARALGLPR
jgi:alkylation response protein AidB-like acyl-CoA dehydrogenase